MYEQSLVERYKNIKARADRGDGGERTTAGRLLVQMEEKYPGIGAQAFTPRGEAWTDPNKEGTNWWDNIFAQASVFAQRAAETAAQMAAQYASVDYAVQCARNMVEVKHKSTDHHGFTRINTKIESEQLAQLRHRLTPEQKQVFVETVTEEIAQLLYLELE